MIDNIRAFQADIDYTIRELKKIRAKQIYHKFVKENCKANVDYFFRQIRIKIVDDRKDKLIASLDDSFQDLLLLTHKNSLKSSYMRLLTNIKKDLITLETHALYPNIKKSSNEIIDRIDKEIINTLKNLTVPSALSYKQALLDLQSNTRLSWRGPATDLRESLRECLDYLAPDDDVKVIPGYKQNSDTNGPTMKQKVQHILKNRGKGSAEIKATEDATTIIDEMIGSFVRSVYTRANVSTHTPTDKNEIYRLLNMARTVFCEILEIN